MAVAVLKKRAQIPGISFEQNATGRTTFARIDLRRHGQNELLEDFLDSQAIEARKGDETISWEEVKAKINKKHSL